MVSIINTATNINEHTGVHLTGRTSHFPEKNYLFSKSVSRISVGLLDFYCSLGAKGKYALFILFVLLTSLAKAQNINTPNKNGPLGTQVNTLTGNLFVPRNDMYISARGIDFDISFSYNTFNYNQNSGYGNGWTFNYGMHYSIDTAGVVTIYQGDNRADKYTPAAGGTFTPQFNIFDNLTQYQTGKYVLQNKFGMKYYFDNATHKRLTKIQDPNGNYLNLNYADSLVTSIVNAAGQQISLTYSGGHLATVVDAIASPTHTYSYTYDGYGNLIQVLDPLGNKTVYKYLVNGPLSEATDKNGNSADIIYFPNYTVSELISCNGHKSFSYDSTSKTTVVTDYVPTGTNQVTTYTYASFSNQGITKSWLTHVNGNCCGYNVAFNYDTNGNLINITNANGNVYTYTYDNMGNLLTITDPLGNKSSYTYLSTYNQVTSFTDANGNSYAINYDNAGNPTQVTEPGNISVTGTYSALGDLLTGTDGNGDTYHFAYDAYGYPTQTTQPLSSSYTLGFDARGNMISSTDANGNAFGLHYDVLNRLTSVTDPLSHTSTLAYDANDNITSFTDQNGHSNTYSYDASNRMVATTDATGAQRQYVYDAVDNLIQYKDPLGKTTTYGYDNLNRMVSITDALGNGYSFAYDNNDNVISIALPTGATANFTYDKMDRPISGTDSIGSIGTITYDNNGNMTSYTNGTGSTMSLTYDALNRITKTTDPLGNSRSFNYDNNDNFTSTTDRNAHTTSYAYDALNRPTTITDNNGKIIKITYDAAGNVLTATDPNNNVTTYTYDALQRQTSITYPNATSMHFGYDNTQNMLSRQLADGTTITYQYDAQNRMIKKILPGNPASTFTYDAKSRLTGATNVAGTVSLTYDDVDRPASETFNGHTTKYTYNSSTRSKSITYPDGSNVTWTYDIRNRLSNISKSNANLATYKYNNANQPQQLNYLNGTVTNWQYDQANRLTNLSTQTSGLPVLAFTYDKEDNKTAVSRANLPQFSEQYGYDAGNRLTSFTQGATSNTYAYDNVGNRTTANLNGTSNVYSVNNLNQYTSLNNNGQTTNFTYDGNGNLTFDGTFYKRYDALNKLLVDSNSNGKIQYFYDALGRRVQKTVNGNSVSYYYAGLKQLEQRNTSNDALLNETVYSNSITPVMVAVNNNSYYYHQNDLNSVEAISSSNGNLAERYQYDVYGQPSIYDSLGNALTSSNIGNRFAFTGQEYDAETKSYSYHYRNYNPATGNFNQRDPIGYGDNMGLYQYVHDNPGNYVDLFGLSPCPPPPPQYVMTNSDLESHVGNMLTLLTQLKALEKSNKFSNTATGADITTLIISITKYLDPNNGLSQKDQNALGGDIALQSTYVAADLSPNTPINEGPKLAIGLVSKLDASVQELTSYLSGGGSGMSLSAIYAHQSDAAENYGQNMANQINDSYTRRQQTIDNYIKEHGEDQSTWSTKMKFLYKLQQSFKNNRQQTTSVVQGPASSPCPPNNNNHGNQNPTPPGPQNPGTPFSSNNIAPGDPNEIIGPTGVGTPQFVNAVAPLPYIINFANSASASAPAKTVRINYPIDPKQDMNNISLGSFGFNNLSFNVPNNTAAYYQRLDARDSLGLYVDITAGLDVNNHQIFWVFQSIDPVTLLTPDDPLKGFLLLSDTSNSTSGHGYVNFSIKPISTDVTGDTTHAIASIVFDSNDPVPTNVAKNTIDAGAPTSHMNALPANSTSTIIPLSWTATDDAHGSGVASYSLYVAVNNGAFSLYATNIAGKDTTFTGASGNSYSFFVLGTDSVGNTETLKVGAETMTYINAVVLPVTWLYFTAVSQGKDGFLNWATATETNTASYEVERSIDGRNFTAIGSVAAAGNSTVQTNYTYTDKNVVSLNIPVVYYRLKQIDKDGKTSYSNIVAVQLPVVNVGPIVQAYPNPFKQTLNILIANITALDLSDNIAIYTLEGQIVYTKPIGQRLLNTTITLTDLPQLTPGMYILKLGLNKQTYSFKLMKQ